MKKQTSIRIPVDLRELIDKLRKAEKPARSFSSMVVFLLYKAVKSEYR
jgi:hypothetical protein